MAVGNQEFHEQFANRGIINDQRPHKFQEKPLWDEQGPCHTPTQCRAIHLHGAQNSCPRNSYRLLIVAPAGPYGEYVSGLSSHHSADKLRTEEFANIPTQQFLPIKFSALISEAKI
jgi:hypothetical protein